MFQPSHRLAARLRSVSTSVSNSYSENLEILAATQRLALRTGCFNRHHFRAALEKLVAQDRAHESSAADSFLDEFLKLPPIGWVSLPERECQPYIPLPAQKLLELVNVAKIGAHDTFFDLGSGLGRVLFTVHLLTEAHCIGIERNPALVAMASEAAKGLGVSKQVKTLEQDIGDADYQSASVIFAYAPCFGKTWRRCADKLIHTARSSPLTIITFGPLEPYLRDAGVFEYSTTAGFQIHRSSAMACSERNGKRITQAETIHQSKDSARRYHNKK